MINRTISAAAFEGAGLDAMGPASGQLAAQWSEDTPRFDGGFLTLTVDAPARWHAPAGGVLIWSGFGAPDLTDSSGAALEGIVAVLRFHPQTVLRLARLIGARHDGRTDGRAGRPVPVCAAIRDGDPPSEIGDVEAERPTLPPQSATTGAVLTHGRLTFHDERGLLIDPVAVACLFRDLMRGFPALLHPGGGVENDLEAATGTAGSIGRICALASGRRLHVVDLFGRPWVARPGAPGVRLNATTDLALDAGPNAWADGEELQLTAGAPLVRFALLPQGRLGAGPVAAPTFPATAVPAGSPDPVLEREFLRVAVVDLDLHLLGNRSGITVEGVAAPDAFTRAEPPPVVRDGVVDFLADGQATTGAVSEVAGLAGFRLAASPVVDDAVALPPDRVQRWPARPPLAETAVDLDGPTAARAKTDATAAYAGASADVVVTWPAGALPAEAHVRLFPRLDPGPAEVPLAELDFSLRGDGTAGIARAAGLTLLLADPFRVGGGPRPAAPTLIADLLIVTRGPSGVQGRLLGGLQLPVTPGGTAPAPPVATNALAALADTQRGVSPSPLLGLPPTQPAGGSDPVLAALGEAAPREAPRYRTMARGETIVAGHDGAAPGEWTAVLTAGLLNGRSVRDDARLGNPGNPAGPEEHAPGLRVRGPLAQDLARAALRRTHHLATRLPELNDPRWDEQPPAPGSAAVFGAVLHTIAETVESPELSLLPRGTVEGLPGTWTALMNQIGGLLAGTSLASLPASAPVPAAGDRWVGEVRRESFAALQGRRDTQWSLRWALSRARTLVYLDSALLGETGRAADGEHAVDLVLLLRQRLIAQPDLRVVVVLPKRVPFGPGYESFAQRHHLARNAAVADLRSPAERRVIAYQPMGFPGRPEVRRGTLAVVDDVWALAGASTLSRRGLTFDGGVDVAFVDRQLRDSTSAGVADLRRLAMARTLGVAPPQPGQTPDPRWVRLAQPRSAFTLLAETLQRGGDGLLEPLWPGLPEAELPALDAGIADPDGRGFSAVLQLFAGVLADLGSGAV